MLFIALVAGTIVTNAQTIDLQGAQMENDSVVKKVFDAVRYNVSYACSYASDATVPELKDSAMKVLLIGDKYNCFIDYGQLLFDSITDNASKSSKYATQEQINKMMSVSKLLNYKLPTVLIDKVNNKQTNQQSIAGNKYEYTEPTIKPQWTMAEGDTTIAGYACKKATTTLYGRNWVAWYAPEVEITYGPYKFSGLPGLIFYVADTENNFVFTLQGLRKVTDYEPIYIAPEAEKSTRKGVRQMYKNYCDNPLKVLLATNPGIIVPEGTQAPPRPYNPIERE